MDKGKWSAVWSVGFIVFSISKAFNKMDFIIPQVRELTFSCTLQEDIIEEG